MLISKGAQILDFATKNQKIWPNLLPWALLSMRAAYRDDINASPSELAHGLQPCLPGSIILTPQPSQHLQDLLSNTKNKTDRPAVQTKINKPNPIIDEPPMDVTHAYTLQHNKKRLDPSYRGPFRIKSRISRSTARLIVGHYANGDERYEDRHWSELKAVKLPANVKEDSRAKLGRPSNNPNPLITTGSPSSQPFTGFKTTEIPSKNMVKWSDDIMKTISSIDFSKPPPSQPRQFLSATKEELNHLNNLINTWVLEVRQPLVTTK